MVMGGPTVVPRTPTQTLGEKRKVSGRTQGSHGFPRLLHIVPTGQSLSKQDELTAGLGTDSSKLRRHTEQASGTNTSLHFPYCIWTWRQIGSLPSHFVSCLERNKGRERQQLACISNGLKKKKAIPSIYKIGLQFCRILLGPGGNFENTFILFHPYQSCLFSLPPHWPPEREQQIFPQPLGDAADPPGLPRCLARGSISLVLKVPLWGDRASAFPGGQTCSRDLSSAPDLQPGKNPSPSQTLFVCTRKGNNPKQSKDKALEQL